MFNWILFRKTVLAVIFLELLSLAAYLVPSFNTIAYIILLFLVLVLSLERLEYGVYIVVTELIIGSFGYLFSLPLGGVNLSLRMGIFLVVFAAGIVQMIRDRSIYFLKSTFLKYYLGFACFVVLSIVVGILRGNGMGNVFFDSNAFIFFAYAPIFYQALPSFKRVSAVVSVAVGAVVGSLIKTFALLYVFSHEMWYIMPELYGWVRDTRVGEITRISDGMYRIFFQSHIFVAIGLLIALIFLFFKYIFPLLHTKNSLEKNEVWLLVLSTGLTAGVLISMSRSFWLASAVVVGMLCLLIIFVLKYYVEGLIKIILTFFTVAFLSVVLLWGVTQFPYPRINFEQMSAAQALAQRSINLSGEAAVSSRWALLPVLWQAIKVHPFMGSGFGTTVTYKSSDPRVIAQSAGQSGEYTTFAFEWGYADLWLKLGLLGLIAYLVLLANMLYRGIVNIRWSVLTRQSVSLPIDSITVLRLGMLSGALLIGAVHFFTPYLNHPLGIGFIILAGLIFELPREHTSID